MPIDWHIGDRFIRRGGTERLQHPFCGRVVWSVTVAPGATTSGRGAAVPPKKPAMNRHSVPFDATFRTRGMVEPVEVLGSVPSVQFGRYCYHCRFHLDARSCILSVNVRQKPTCTDDQRFGLAHISPPAALPRTKGQELPHRRGGCPSRRGVRRTAAHLPRKPAVCRQSSAKLRYLRQTTVLWIVADSWRKFARFEASVGY
jgi:hypothetical protein